MLVKLLLKSLTPIQLRRSVFLAFVPSPWWKSLRYAQSLDIRTWEPADGEYAKGRISGAVLILRRSGGR